MHELPRERLSEKGYEQRSKRGFGRYTERKMDRKPLLGGPLGYPRSASETFRTVSLGNWVNRGNGATGSLTTSSLAVIVEEVSDTRGGKRKKEDRRGEI
jgi:hypothetical protein